MLLSTAWARQGFFYKLWTEGDPEDWVKVQARVDEYQHLTPEDIDRERRALPAAVFAREFDCQFDSLETRFFGADALASAFGDDVIGPEPDGVTYEGNKEDPDPLAHERVGETF